jgi:hypothetical protein
MHRSDRGSSLLLAMIALAVLSILAAAALTYTGQESSSASQFEKREALSACATAARNWMMSFFQAGSSNGVDMLKLAGRIDAGRFWIQTGHLDQIGLDGGFAPGIELGEGTLSTVGFSDLTNTTLKRPGGAGGGLRRAYRAVATCVDKETRAVTEAEFEVLLAL